MIFAHNLREPHCELTNLYTMKKTKIVCTIGPASDSVQMIRKMIKAGMNFARLNLSHATLDYHKKLIRNVRTAARLEGEYVGLLADLQGPKIRVGILPKDGVLLKKGETIVFALRDKFLKNELPLSHKELFKDLNAGERILIDDGLVELKIDKVSSSKIYSTVVTSGKVTSHKGINLPDSNLRLKSLTEKDRRDVKFALREDVQWLALSFVRSARDIEDLRKLIRGRRQKIIAKIEKVEALQNIDDIIEVSHGIMIARGDLGIEAPAEEVPLAQKDIIKKCLFAAKPVIVATQMLDSMIRSPRPTRAEVSDVANAVMDHTDAVMLSGESAGGAYPLAAVKMMKKIVLKTESSPFDNLDLSYFHHRSGLQLASAEAAAHLALEAKAKLIYIDGPRASEEAQLISHFRQELPIFVKVKDEFEACQLNLNWGIRPFIRKTFKEFIKKGDKVLFVKTNKDSPQEMMIKAI